MKLRTDVDWVKLQIECERGILGRPDPDTHDAAVAHALVRAMELELPCTRILKIEKRAAQILRDDFWIDNK